MKAEIGKILKQLSDEVIFIDRDTNELVTQATSSLTALIIKWLEEKKSPHYAFLSNKDLKTTGKLIECRTIEDWQKYSRNQLITELIGELR